MGRNHKYLLNSLEKLRKSVGLTQQELSESAGVSRKSINAIENGIYVPLYSTCSKKFQGLLIVRLKTYLNYRKIIPEITLTIHL